MAFAFVKKDGQVRYAVPGVFLTLG